ncbi:hypothetical protein [Halobacterium salinarum]|nr:hypothetical protein [Halobacterium salinarum]MDL0127308.1 hypothetical protein [Halobacterium salinarum]
MTGVLAAARRGGPLRGTAVAAVAIAVLFRVALGEPWPTTVAATAAGG